MSPRLRVVFACVTVGIGLAVPSMSCNKAASPTPRITESGRGNSEEALVRTVDSTYVPHTHADSLALSQLHLAMEIREAHSPEELYCLQMLSYFINDVPASEELSGHSLKMYDTAATALMTKCEFTYEFMQDPGHYAAHRKAFLFFQELLGRMKDNLDSQAFKSRNKSSEE